MIFFFHFKHMHKVCNKYFNLNSIIHVFIYFLLWIHYEIGMVFISLIIMEKEFNISNTFLPVKLYES